MNRHVAYYLMSNAPILNRVPTEPNGDDAETIGWRFGHMKLPADDFERVTEERRTAVGEGMFVVGQHKPAKTLQLGRLLSSSNRTWQPAGVLAQRKMCAAAELLLTIGDKYGLCLKAQCSCIMGYGLFFQRVDGTIWLSLGHAVYGFLAVECVQCKVHEDRGGVREPATDRNAFPSSHDPPHSEV
jgi:hypothetical protein